MLLLPTPPQNIRHSNNAGVVRISLKEYFYGAEQVPLQWKVLDFLKKKKNIKIFG